jgi:prepilin-type N-terminal cleavage/methylation domain-containing protein
MRKAHTLRLRQAGDTIVEVLIAIAVISLVLAGAYATVHKSTAIMQNTQERGQAQKYVEQQIELMREYYSANKASYLAASDWCIGPTGSVNAGNPCTMPDPAAYKIVINSVAATPGTFEISAKWDSLTGTPSNVTMYYRPE